VPGVTVIPVPKLIGIGIGTGPAAAGVAILALLLAAAPVVVQSLIVLAAEPATVTLTARTRPGIVLRTVAALIPSVCGKLSLLT